MSDRRSRRIREQLRQHPNPRAPYTGANAPFADQLRRAYIPPHAAPSSAPDLHAQLARQIADRRGRR